MASVFKEVSELMAGLKHCVALIGAGISAESGIATFRSKGGLWEKYDPMIYASIEVFREDPAKYWTIRGEFIRDYDTYQPNKAHLALAQQQGAKIVEVNIESAFAGADFVVEEKAGAGLSRILEEIKIIVG